MTDRCRHDHGHEQPARPPEVGLMADYGCWLWTNSPELHRFRDDHGDLDPVALGIAPELVSALREWHEEWEQANFGGGWWSGSPSLWSRRGWELALRLQDDLGSGIEVRYFHGVDHAGQGAGWDTPVRERQVALERGPEPAVLELRPGREIATLRLRSPGAPPFDEGDWLDPQELGIDPQLGRQLREWNAAWPAVALRAGEPLAPGRRPWVSEGNRLADLLRDVLAVHGHVQVVLDQTR